MVSFIWIDAFFFTVGEHVPEILLQIEVPVPCPEKDENRDAQNRKIQDDEIRHGYICLTQNLYGIEVEKIGTAKVQK